jgi:hypothetical protein
LASGVISADENGDGMARVGDLDHHPGPRKRSLEKLLRRTFEIQEDKEEQDRSRKAVRAILDALAKYYWEPGHACFIDCPCQKREKP